VSRPNSLLAQLQDIETNLIEDVVMATLIFVTISVAWSAAPDSWPRFIYYVLLAVGIFGYFAYVSPPPNDTADT